MAMKGLTNSARQLGIVLLAIPMLAGAQSDDELIETLAAASSYQEINLAIQSVTERLVDGPPSQQFLDELMRVATTNPEVAKRSGSSMLSLIRGQAPYGEQSLIYIAEALGSGIPFSRRVSLENILTSGEVQPVSDDIFAILMQNLESSYPRSSMSVLTSIDLSETRSAQVSDALRRNWERGDSSRYDKDFVIEKFVSMYGDAAMPVEIVDSLVNLALTDPHLSPRVSALEAVSLQSVDATRSDEVGRALSAYFVPPMSYSYHDDNMQVGEYGKLRSRAAHSLVRLVDAPYPDYVVDLWLREIAINLFWADLDTFQEVISTRPLTDDQFVQLTRTLDNGLDKMRAVDGLLGLSYPPVAAELLEYSAGAFESSFDVTTKVQAGYRLLLHYGSGRIPTAVADVAAGYLDGKSGNELLPVSLYLVGNAAEDEARYTELLVDAAARHADDLHRYRKYLSVFSDRNTDSLVLRYAGDQRQPERFRSTVIRYTGLHLDEGEPLSPDVAELLDNIARNDESTLLVQVAGSALETHGASVPLRVTLTDRDFQGTLLAYVFLGMVALNTIAFFAGLISAHMAPGGTVKGVVGRLAQWSLLTIVVVAALLFGLVGFIGHNSSPAPATSLAMNIPAMVVTALYVAVAWHWVRRARKEKHEFSDEVKVVF
jgi:hypothetical protein